VLFVSNFGISKSFAPVFQVTILLTWTVAGLVLRKTLSALGNASMKKAGMMLCLSGALSFALISFLTPQNPYLLVGSFLPFIFGANWIFGLYFPEAMELLPEIKGVVASILTSIRLFIAAITVACTSVLYNTEIYPLTSVILAALAVILPCLISYEKKYGIKKETKI